jgi:hypothetical protein
MSINDAVKTLQELYELEAQGLVLPYAPTIILQQEILGNTVDLMTGEIVIGGVERESRVRMQPTWRRGRG